MTTSTHTHEELATKKDVDARFDRIEERLERVEDRLLSLEHTVANLASSLASLLTVFTNLNERVTALEKNQRVMMQMLERIENSTNRQIGF